MRKALYLLGILDDVDVNWLADKGTVWQAAPEETVIFESVPTDSLYILLEGQLSVRSGRNDSVEIAALLPGEIVGEMSFVDSRPPSASVIATRPSFLLKISRVALKEKLEKDTAFAARFYRAIAGFLADRLYVTVGRFGYGSYDQDHDVDEIDGSAMEELSIAANRFDDLVKRARGDYRSRVQASSSSQN